MAAPPYADVIGNLARATEAVLYPTAIPAQQVEECNVVYVCTATGGGDSRGLLASAIDAVWQTAYLGLLPSTAKMFGCKISILNQFPAPLAKTVTTNVPGTSAGTQLPTQARGLWSWRTSVGGRGGRGRVYAFTPSSLSINADGNPTAAYVTALGTLAANLASFTVGGTTWQAVVAHRSKTRPFTYTFDQITGATARLVWATQRRSGDTGRINADPW